MLTSKAIAKVQKLSLHFLITLANLSFFSESSSSSLALSVGRRAAGTEVLSHDERQHFLGLNCVYVKMFQHAS